MTAAGGPLVVDRAADGVLVLRLNRPEKRNAIDGSLVEALIAAFEHNDDMVAVLTSTDPAVFCAGADFTLPDAERAHVSDRLYELYGLMVGRSAPVIAAIGGAAVGGGAQLAIASDIRIAGPAAVLRFAGPGHGIAVGAWALPSLVGRGRALDLCLSMRSVHAEEAAAFGLVDHIAAEPAGAALELAASFARLDGEAVARVKDVARVATSLTDALDRERRGNRERWSGSVEGLAW